MGKGHQRRPRFVPLAELAARWDATFGTQETTEVAYRALATHNPSPIVGLTGYLDRLAAEGIVPSPLPSDPDERQA